MASEYPSSLNYALDLGMRVSDTLRHSTTVVRADNTELTSLWHPLRAINPDKVYEVNVRLLVHMLDQGRNIYMFAAGTSDTRIVSSKKSAEPMEN